MAWDWRSIITISVVHLMAVVGLVYAFWKPVPWPTVILAIAWYWLCGLSITGGYHRLFAHRTYRSAGFLKWFYLLFGAASLQNSALKWASDHRRHHAHTDGPDDPYNIQRGFWWAHMGWIFRKGPPEDFSNVPDLVKDRGVVWQHRYYVPLACVMGGMVPAALGAVWRDAWGALLLAGFVRLAFQYHCTFAINSFAHTFGSRPYLSTSSARDNFWLAFLTFGEGFHHFHHRFPTDYRNGVKWYHFDPTKWWIWGWSLLGATRDLRKGVRH